MHAACRFLRAAHEGGHEQIAIAAGHHIAEELGQVPPAATCDDFDAVARHTVQLLLGQHDRDQLAYDRATQHGLSQGAVFP
jgi:predicted secreted Zn-dependent protease